MDDEKIIESLGQKKLESKIAIGQHQKYYFWGALCQRLQKGDQEQLDHALKTTSATVFIAILKIFVKLTGRDKIK